MLKKYLKHVLIHLLSFIINYLIFIILMFIMKTNNAVTVQIINLIAWIISMLFIFYIDKKYVPDLINENNSSELFKFILIRILSFMIEAIILFIFISIFKSNYYMIKLISLSILFIFNNFYVRKIQLV